MRSGPTLVGVSPPPALAEVASIAVLRANAMGDYLVCEPALAAIRVAAPQARITLLGGSFAASALPHRPGPVDEVVLVPYLDGLRQPPSGTGVDDVEVAHFYDQMRTRRFDLALQLHGGGRNSNPVVLALGAAYTAGLRAFDAPALDRSVDYQFWQHEVFRYLEVAAAIGAPPVRVQPHFEVLPEDVQVSFACVPKQQRPLVVVHPGATDPRRRWPASHFAQVADALTDRGALVCVIGNEEEVHPVADRARDVRVLTDTSFAQLVGLLARATLLVGNDSGPRHLAEAVGTPTVSVYWCGNMVNAGPTVRHNHRAHISWTTHCPVCGISMVGEPFPARCCDTVTCVSDVPVAHVLGSALELFEQAHHQPNTSVGG